MAHGTAHHLENRRALALALAITSVYLVVEAAGGFFTNSLSLLADAAHMFSDVAALSLALFAVWMSSRPSTPRKTFGYYRIEVLVAALNAVILVAVMGYIFWEAYRRLESLPEVHSVPMMAIAAFGLLANVASAVVLLRCEAGGLNVRAALFHVLGDALGSVGALTAALIMIFTGRFLADPILGILIGVLIAFGAWRILSEAVNVLLEGAPHDIPTGAVADALREIDGVKDVHDLHIWTITSDFVSLSAHITIGEGEDSQALLCELQDTLRRRFGVQHMTLQLETRELQEDFLHD